MQSKFLLSCESTVDLPYDYVAGRNISVLYYTYSFGDGELADDMGRDEEALPEFYRRLRKGEIPVTSQINTTTYEAYFEDLLKKGDVLHIAFGSGMTSSVYRAEKAAENLREKYPERHITVIDSLCSSAGYGMLVDSAADLRDAGKSMEETEAWLLTMRTKVHHQFFSTDLTYFRRSGRMSGPAASVAAILNICPLMHLDKSGHIVAYDKVRGRKNAVKETVNAMAAHAEGGKDYEDKCFIVHSDCIREAECLREEIMKTFPKLESVPVYPIGTIIASHSGPGTVAVFFYGDEREKK